MADKIDLLIEMVRDQGDAIGNLSQQVAKIEEKVSGELGITPQLKRLSKEFQATQQKVNEMLTVRRTATTIWGIVGGAVVSIATWLVKQMVQ